MGKKEVTETGWFILQAVTNVLALLFGLCFGSFANVIIYRLPRGESINKPPSHCPSCNHRLSAFDLMPVLSWLFLRGKCRYCKAKVSVRYPVVELLCAALFVFMALYAGPSPAVIPLCAFAFMLLCVTFIDFETQEIHDGLLVFGAVFGVAWVAVSHFTPIGAPVWYDALLGALAGAAPLFLIDRVSILLLKKDGFGYGDVKLMAVAGLFLGWQMTLLSLFFAVVAGGVFGVFMLATKRLERGGYFAFGPFLSVGILAALWFGRPVLDFYMQLFM